MLLLYLTAGAAQTTAKKKGAGTKMLDDMRRKGKPITPKLEEMALWLDSLDTSTLDDGQVSCFDDMNQGYIFCCCDVPTTSLRCFALCHEIVCPLWEIIGARCLPFACGLCLQVQMVKPGDASMASPFTAKQGHIMPCTDILKQGRSTLVTTVQMFKILGLLCLSTAYSLSVMYLQVSHPSLNQHLASVSVASTTSCVIYVRYLLLPKVLLPCRFHSFYCNPSVWIWKMAFKPFPTSSAERKFGSVLMQGVKLGDMQATVQGFLSTGLFFVISNSTPLPTLSAERPHPTIFSLYVFLSVLGQAAVHLALLVSFYFGALHLMPQVRKLCGNKSRQMMLIQVKAVNCLSSGISCLKQFCTGYASFGRSTLQLLKNLRYSEASW